MNEKYLKFLSSKAPRVMASGIEPGPMPDHLFDFQAAAVSFAIRQGRAALFEDTGLGKTRQELEFIKQCIAPTNGTGLILTPLAVSWQIEAEGLELGYDCRLVKDQSGVRPGINICNYDRLDLLDCSSFDAVALDESSCLKNFSGVMTRSLIAAFKDCKFRLCATATPAPNDHTELGNHAEFLGIMAMSDMLIRWFINDTNDTGTWRLKGHAQRDFWDWMASWAIMASSPTDLGFDGSKFVLPPMEIVRHQVLAEIVPDDGLFGFNVSATNMFALKKQTADVRADAVAKLVYAEPNEPWVIWCDTDGEADALLKRIPEATEVRGSHSPEKKEERLAAFSSGKSRIIITKAKIAGMGLNWQHAARMAFVGRSFSYEAWYQAVRRCWRFGQKRPVIVHLIVAEGEDQIGRVIDAKSDGHASMKANMRTASMRAMGRSSNIKVPYLPKHEGRLPLWLKAKWTMNDTVAVLNEMHGRNYSIYNADCVDLVRQLPDRSIGFSVYSPPFSNLFAYSDSESDMGNSADDGEFFTHYGFLLEQMTRVFKPGRLSAVHCSDLPLTKWKDGIIGIKDFSGDIIRAHQAFGWTLHSRVTIWKDPVVEMTRTKAPGLLYKQLKKDRTRSRQGMADYLLVFRAPGENLEPVGQDSVNFPVELWQKWASPVWMDIRQPNTLNVQQAREGSDERHLCPLQLDLIERSILMWSNPGDIVLSPFTGIGSEGFVAIKQKRKFVGVELKGSYFSVACKNLANAEANAVNLFDLCD